MDKELLYNQSGVKDETAYKAIKNLRSGGSAFMSGYEINKGEIWEVKDNNYGTKMVVVINCYDRYAATIMLQDQEPGSNAVPVKARSIMYADAGRLGYTFYDKMVDFVRALSEEEDYELRRAIAEALALPDDETPLDSMAADANREIDGLQYEIAQLRKEAKEKTEAVAELTLRLEAARAEADVLRRKLEEAPKQGYVELVEEHSLREDLAAARQEAQIYKGLYEKLLDKALG